MYKSIRRLLLNASSESKYHRVLYLASVVERTTYSSFTATYMDRNKQAVYGFNTFATSLCTRLGLHRAQSTRVCFTAAKRFMWSTPTTASSLDLICMKLKQLSRISRNRNLILLMKETSKTSSASI